MIQFLAEAFVLTAVAALLSVGLFVLCRPLFAGVVGRSLPSLAELPWRHGWVVVAGVMVVGGLAGGYPALYLSAQSAVNSLRGRGQSAREGQWFRRGLVTVQFTIALVVFVGAVFVSRQIAYFFAADLGFQKESLLTVSSLPRTWTREGVARMEAARDQLARLPGVRSASLSYEIPNGNVGNSGNLYRQSRDSTQAVSVQIMTTDERYADTYRIGLRAGRYFHAGQGRYDSTSVVVNEVAAKALGFTPETAIGQAVRFQGVPLTYLIGGVVADFHVGTLHQSVGPLVIGQVRAVPIYRFFTLRLAAGNPGSAIESLERTWRGLFPDAPFDYAFMDQTLAKLYRTELQLERAAYVATALALLIVLLGVVGLVSLSVARRTKEVGIRKVLGAGVPSIVGLFLGEYGVALLVANAVAWPLTYWLIADWLTNYAYHTALTWHPFVLTGIGLALLTGAVVSLQVIKTALMNPVDSLRSE